VVETAHRLTRIGGTVLKAEFPFDAGVTDERAWDEACRELDAASALPWVLLSGGVGEETFARQVAVACRAGASGVLVGRSVWAPAATLAPAERDAWLLAEGRARLGILVRLADELGTPWHARPNPLAAAALPAKGGTGNTERVTTERGRAPGGGERDIDILVLGELNPDVIVRGTDPRLEFGQVERLVEAIDLVIGSSSAIFACGAATLGLRVAFVGVVGDDAMGRFMLDAMGARGVDVSACRVDPGTPTGASVILTRGNDRAILTAPGTVPLLRDEDVPDGLVGRARHLHVGSVYLLDVLRPRLAGRFEAARRAGSRHRSTATGTRGAPGMAAFGGSSVTPTSSCRMPPK